MGVVLNANWAQMGDFMLGWLGIDFAGDDGRKLGAWPWQLDEPPAEARPAPQRRPPEEIRPPAERPTVRPKERPKARESVEPPPQPKPRPAPPPPRVREGLSPRLDDQP